MWATRRVIHANGPVHATFLDLSCHKPNHVGVIIFTLLHAVTPVSRSETPNAIISLQQKKYSMEAPKMKQQFALILNSDLAINRGFSLDELVSEARKLFEEEGIPVAFCE